MAQIYCTQCGKSANIQSNFCGHCGAPLHGEAAADAYQSRRSGQSKTTRQASNSSSNRSQRPSSTELNVIREHVDPISQLTLFMNYLAATGVVLLLGIVVTFIDLWIGLCVVVGYLAIIGLAAYLTWSNFFYTVDEVSFQKQYGIFHKKNVTIPFGRIQNVNITRTFIDQILGLARIDIETAGSSEGGQRQIIGGSLSKAEGHIPGISLKKAKSLHDILLDRAASSQQRGL